MGGPHQLKTGHRRTFAEFLAIADQAFGQGEVIGLMDQGKPVLIEPVLDLPQGEPVKIEIKACEQIDGSDAVFDRHPIPTLKHNGLSAGQQDQRRQGIDRCGARAPVEGHAETHR